MIGYSAIGTCRLLNARVCSDRRSSSPNNPDIQISIATVNGLGERSFVVMPDWRSCLEILCPQCFNQPKEHMIGEPRALLRYVKSISFRRRTHLTCHMFRHHARVNDPLSPDRDGTEKHSARRKWIPSAREKGRSNRIQSLPLLCRTIENLFYELIDKQKQIRPFNVIVNDGNILKGLF